MHVSELSTGILGTLLKIQILQGDVNTQNYRQSLSINEFLCPRSSGNHGDLGKLEMRSVGGDVGEGEGVKQMCVRLRVLLLSQFCLSVCPS